MKNLISNTKQSGFTLLLVMAMTLILMATMGGLATVGIYRQKLYKQQEAKHEALYIAEAGINYYVWHLAHNPDDFYDGTGIDPGDPGEPYGPYQHLYTAPSSGRSGVFELEITPPPTGSTIVTIKSTGWLNEYPNIKRSITVKYGIPSLAQYSFLTNTDVWFSNNEQVRGKLHSNGGIRMDGTNDSLVTSALTTYICQPEHGCSQSNCASPCSWTAAGCECPGVWGSGPNSNLWNYPVPAIDFNTITLDISQMKTEAQTNGIYLPPTNGNEYGYHIKFLANGTFDVYTINSLKSPLAQLNEAGTGFVYLREEINTETFDNNYSIPANGLIFAEDDVWVDGIVNGRATLIAARLPDNPNQRKSIIINDNLEYLARDGNNVLGLIAQQDIKVPKHAPTNLTIDAILLAQNGRCFRNYYLLHKIGNNIEIYGSIITNKLWTWSWVNNFNTVIDGYLNTTSIYDSNVIFSPPPFFPNTGEYDFISWEEK